MSYITYEFDMTKTTTKILMSVYNIAVTKNICNLWYAKEWVTELINNSGPHLLASNFTL